MFSFAELKMELFKGLTNTEKLNRMDRKPEGNWKEKENVHPGN